MLHRWAPLRRLIVAAPAAPLRAAPRRMASTYIVPPQYTGVEAITRSDIATPLDKDQVRNMLANQPRGRRAIVDRVTGEAVAHGGRKHTRANVWLKAVNPLDSPHVCPDWINPAHPGGCRHRDSGVHCYRDHPSLDDAAAAIDPANASGSDILINRQPYHEYFRRWSHRGDVTAPLLLTNTLGRFKVRAIVAGGGLTGQAQAVRHALANALQEYNPTMRSALKVAGLLRRDDRVVERKKWGQYKARKQYTWVKR